MTYWDELEAKAQAFFERSALAMGFKSHTPWCELEEDTREMYRRELVRRMSSDQPKVSQ